MIKLLKGDPTPFSGYVVMDDGNYQDTDLVRICKLTDVHVCAIQMQANFVKNKTILLDNGKEKAEVYDPKTELTAVVK